MCVFSGGGIRGVCWDVGWWCMCVSARGCVFGIGCWCVWVGRMLMTESLAVHQDITHM